MKKYRVSFTEKKTGDIVKSVVVESDDDIGIIIKGKIVARPDGFRWDKRKYTASFMEIS